MILEGTEEEINRAGSILQNRGIQNWNVYAISGDRSSSNVASAPINRQTQTYTNATIRDREFHRHR